MFALSTAWNADRYIDGKSIAQEIYKLGIKEIELNFSLTKVMVEEILQFAKQEEIQITSLHNYCPIPNGFSRQEALPDCISLSSTDEDERKKAVEYTKITIDTAKRSSAKTVILHCGRVEIEDRTRHLIRLCNDGKKNSPLYQEILNSAKKERKIKSPEYFAQILKSLSDLCNYAQKKDIVLGIENRFYYREIPSFEELEIIFDHFKDKPIAYWHDVGHGYILEKIGLLKEESLLKKYGSLLCGVHLHNIKDLIDHRVPYDGDFDFNRLCPFLQPNTLKVLEVHSDVMPDSIKKSIIFLSRVFHD